MPSQVQYPWKNEAVVCLGLWSEERRDRESNFVLPQNAEVRCLRPLIEIELAISRRVLPPQLREYPDPVGAQLFSRFLDLNLQVLDLRCILLRPTTQ